VEEAKRRTRLDLDILARLAGEVGFDFDPRSAFLPTHE
jgi:hypothetical protein